MTSPRRRSTIRAVYLTAIVALGTMFSTAAATAATVEGVALLKSAERQKILVEGAKKEGKLMFYTAHPAMPALQAETARDLGVEPEKNVVA